MRGKEKMQMESFEDRGPEGARDEVLLEKLTRRNETLAREKKKLEEEKDIDTLTGLPKLDTFHKELSKATRMEAYSGEKKRSREEVPSTLAFFDLKKFKLINDTYGHIPGNIVLKEVAHYLKSILREDDFLARYAGDEFVAIVKGITPENLAKKFETLKNNAGTERPVSDAVLGVEVGIPLTNGETKKIWVEISAGLANIRRGDAEADIIHAADQAMYEGKKDHASGGIATQKSNIVEEEN